MSTINKISTDRAPAAIGPYSQAVSVNGMVFTSGQIPVDPATGKVVEPVIEKQAEQVMRNILAVIAEEGLTDRDIVKTTCFLRDMDDFDAFNQVYARYITSKPARSCVAVRTLPKGVLCEVEAVAVL